MATLRKRKNKKGFVYLIDFYLNGKRLVRSTKTDHLPTAKLILKDIEAKIAKKQFNVDDIKPKKKVYLKTFIPEYLDYSQKHKAPKTQRMDRLALRNFLSFCGDRTLDSIYSKLIDGFINHRLETVKKSSVNIELRHLKSAFSKAQNWGYIERNPFKGVKLLKVPENKPKFFNQEQINQLLTVIDKEWFREIFLFAIHTGLRRGEIVNLKWHDVDFDKATFKVSQDGSFTTKSKREHVIPMNDTVFNLLISMKRSREYVFSNENGNKRDDDRLSKQFKYYLEKAGFDTIYSFHSTRHTFASNLVQKGVSLYIVSKLLGHSDIKTTEIYAHLSPETYQDVVRLLDKEKMGVVVR